MKSSRQVQRIILTSDGGDGALYAIAVCTDGVLAIMRNGELLDDAQFESQQMDQCIVDFVRRSEMPSDPAD